mmetsp:Transcript_4013/g.14283  ORF Transcript_4013/g.14283 Transcript_4013/m.14283 type:complete len:541 (-) Transcript_4013:482-2104(-)
MRPHAAHEADDALVHVGQRRLLLLLIGERRRGGGRAHGGRVPMSRRLEGSVVCPRQGRQRSRHGSRRGQCSAPLPLWRRVLALRLSVVELFGCTKRPPSNGLRLGQVPLGRGARKQPAPCALRYRPSAGLVSSSRRGSAAIVGGGAGCYRGRRLRHARHCGLDVGVLDHDGLVVLQDVAVELGLHRLAGEAAVECKGYVDHRRLARALRPRRRQQPVLLRLHRQDVDRPSGRRHGVAPVLDALVLSHLHPAVGQDDGGGAAVAQRLETRVVAHRTVHQHHAVGGPRAVEPLQRHGAEDNRHARGRGGGGGHGELALAVGVDVAVLERRQRGHRREVGVADLPQPAPRPRVAPVTRIIGQHVLRGRDGVGGEDEAVARVEAGGVDEQHRHLGAPSLIHAVRDVGLPLVRWLDPQTLQAARLRAGGLLRRLELGVEVALDDAQDLLDAPATAAVHAQVEVGKRVLVRAPVAVLAGHKLHEGPRHVRHHLDVVLPRYLHVLLLLQQLPQAQEEVQPDDGAAAHGANKVDASQRVHLRQHAQRP